MFRYINGRWIFVTDVTGARMRRAHEKPLFDDLSAMGLFFDNGGTSGGGDNGGDNNSGAGLSSTELAALRSLISTTGTEQETLHNLFAENSRIKTQLAAAQANQIPANALILVGTDVEVWKQLRGLDIPVTDLKGKLDSIAQLEAKVTRMEREGDLRKVIEVTGWNADVFIPLDGIDGVTRTWEIRDTQDGTGKMVFVKEGDDGQPTDAVTYLKTKWPQFMPALFSTGQSAADDQQQGDLQAGGTVVVEQQQKKIPVGAADPNATSNQQQAQPIQGTVYVTQPAGTAAGQQRGKADNGTDLNELASNALDALYGTKKKEAAAA